MFRSTRFVLLTMALFQLGNASPLFGSFFRESVYGGEDGGQCCEQKEPLKLTVALPLVKQKPCCERTIQPEYIPQPPPVQPPDISPFPSPVLPPYQPPVISPFLTSVLPPYQPPVISPCPSPVLPPYQPPVISPCQPPIYTQPEIIEQPSCGRYSW